MEVNLNEYLSSTQKLIEDTILSGIENSMQLAIKESLIALSKGKIIAVAGNGGSHADSTHLVAELVNWFTIKHKALPFFALGTNSAVSTAWSNDHDFESQFERELSSFETHIGLLIVITTSGMSSNIINALKWAKARELPTIGFLGEGGSATDLVDIALSVPSRVTHKIQELHINLYHFYCMEIERLHSDLVI